MSKEFDSSFKVGGTVWNVKITTSIAMKFAGQQNLRLENLLPELLNLEQTLILVWMGIQHHAEAKAFDFDGFVATLEGEYLTDATEAGGYALVNFTLARLPQSRRPRLIELVQSGIDEKKKILAEDGISTPIAEQRPTPICPL